MKASVRCFELAQQVLSTRSWWVPTKSPKKVVSVRHREDHSPVIIQYVGQYVESLSHECI